MEQILPLLSQYPQPGWVVTSIFALLIVRQALNLLKEHVSTFKSLRSIVSHEPKNIEKMVEAERKASLEMSAIAKEFGVDRACIALFHNGTKSLSNTHLLRLSIMIEGLSGRVGPIMSNIQNRNLAEYGDLGYKVVNRREIVSIPNIESIKDSIPSAYIILHFNLVKSLHVAPIVNNETGHVDGCVFVEHCVDPVALSDDEMRKIQARAQAVYNELSKANDGGDSV